MESDISTVTILGKRLEPWEETAKSIVKPEPREKTAKTMFGLVLGVLAEDIRSSPSSNESGDDIRISILAS